MGTKRFSGLAILFSIIGSGLAYLAGEIIINQGNLSDYLKVGLYFGLGAMLLTIMVFVSQKISPQLVGYRWKEQYFKTSLKLFIPTTLLMVGISAGLFQVLYGLKINEPSTIQDIVIALDRSGSMEVTDPEAKRFTAMNGFIDQLKGNKRVALITFNEEANLAIDFTTVSNKKEKENFKVQVANLDIQNDGTTGIQNVIDEAYSQIEKSGRNASLILISDGEPTDQSDTDIAGLVKEYVNHNIPIYTIGMMNTESLSGNYLQSIAALTGGTYYSISDTAILDEVFGSIQYDAEKGTIISPRTGAYIESRLHQGLRVVFLTIISVLIALALGIMFDNKYLVKGMMIGGFIGGMVASLLAEYFFTRGISAALVRLIYWFFVGVGLMSFTWCITFKNQYHGTKTA
ncbi:MAG: VWA domain-containing protein [Cellulosilyticum sp.]|nr:VWA domain-containing protein [Cellulosilyticum sp.]